MATTREARSSRWLRLCRADEIGEAQSRGFDPDDEGQDSLFVVRWQGRLHGWRNACPHIGGAPMAWRRDAYLNAERTRIVCHAHGAEFMPDTGLCVQGPCRGERLIDIELVVDADGELFAKK
ncbi:MULTISPECIES: Rieske (2Fe-2S) protein [unclassified Bradyrhizobium]|uniref:Rieske (2Fe-2S) protein n=1 Tax=unclassified Bradyrhizobium TaxID=2631580 RepID=UPI0028EC14F6|nr:MULTISPECIES: Rieske 2Fe-2S domain-containing protein [unclassified Bradyrhizobium]